MNQPPLIAHVVHRLAVGGMENGLINLINHIPRRRYRHAVVCLTDSTAFRARIQSKDVRIVELNKASGNDLGVYFRFRKTLRELKPDIVHTRNLSALEFQFIAALAGIKARIHGEHGRDVYDPDGRSRKYNMLRGAMRLFVQHYTAVSKNLEEWLVDTVRINKTRVTQIYNGVEADRFRPRGGQRHPMGPDGFMSERSFILGTVGRMEAVKDQLTLVRAFIHLCEVERRAREFARLVIIGDGSLRRQALELLRSAGLSQLAWLPGERDDIPELMRSMDLFVLPSLREGIANTILEAMATGLPVVATRVGGNPELVVEGCTGAMVPPDDPRAMSEAIAAYLNGPAKAADHGRNGRKRVESNFSMETMVTGYLDVYDRLLFSETKPARASYTNIVVDRTPPANIP
jgi:sugar transferase (PEP-CTERM/EpsH1 system associated)